MTTVTSKDGTTIAFEEYGASGPTVILVTGALGVRAAEGADELGKRLAAEGFRVINYDRRGRGKSGDTPPYAVQREIEDIEALIHYAGGTACLFGMSSGGALVIEAANALGSKVAKVVAYEPPFIVDDSHPPVPADYVESLEAAVARGDRGGAVEIFMVKAVGIPAEYVQMMRTMPPQPVGDGTITPPTWASMEAVAHTLAYDGRIMGTKMSGKPLQPNLWPNATSPILVVTGGKSEPFFANGAQAAVAQLPNASHSVLEGQDHAVSPQAIAPVLREFFKG